MKNNLSTPENLTLPSVMVIDDDPDVRQAANLLLRRNGYIVSEAADAHEARLQLAEGQVDLILLDLNLTRGATSGEEGLALLGDIVVRDPKAIVVVVTAHSGVNIAVRAIRAGAVDFVTKPWSNVRLLATLEAALAGRQRKGASPDISPESSMLIGDSTAATHTRELIRRVAPSEASVFIQGGPGAGKSLIARLIYYASARAAGPFVAVDLSALSVDEAEAALFGDALHDQPGALANAKGGVLVLDEVGVLAPRAQARLLSALQTGALIASHGAPRLPVDVRILSLSRRPIGQLESFNRELLHRLSIIEMAAPGTAGGDDIAALTAHFLHLHARRHGRPERPLSPAAQEWLSSATLPEAVRSLSHVIERAVLLATGRTIGLEDLAPPHLEASSITAPRLMDNEKALLKAALKRNGFNVSHAANELGLTRQALYRRMARHGL